MITKAGEGELSDYLVNQTARAKPEGPPQNIEISSRGSNSIQIRWDLPAKPNGPISLYKLSYGYR